MRLPWMTMQGDSPDGVVEVIVWKLRYKVYREWSMKGSSD